MAVATTGVTPADNWMARSQRAVASVSQACPAMRHDQVSRSRVGWVDVSASIALRVVASPNQARAMASSDSALPPDERTEFDDLAHERTVLAVEGDRKGGVRVLRGETVGHRRGARGHEDRGHIRSTWEDRRLDVGLDRQESSRGFDRVYRRSNGFELHQSVELHRRIDRGMGCGTADGLDGACRVTGAPSKHGERQPLLAEALEFDHPHGSGGREDVVTGGVSSEHRQPPRRHELRRPIGRLVRVCECITRRRG